MPGQMSPMQGKTNLVIEVAKEGMKKVLENIVFMALGGGSC